MDTGRSSTACSKESGHTFLPRELRFIVKFTQVRLCSWLQAPAVVSNRVSQLSVQELEGHQMRHLVQALCPAIVGNELIKLGILLALFGGRARSHAAAPDACTRGSIHMLICGDPGLGKSQLLQARLSGKPYDAIIITGRHAP